MLDDSPAVPTMLTDYILKFICPPAEKPLLTNDPKAVFLPKEDNLKPIRPKSSPLQILRENSNEKSNGGYLNASLNQTFNNTIRAARRSFSFRNAIFGGTIPDNNNVAYSTITNDATISMPTIMNNGNMHSQANNIDDLLNNNDHNDPNVLVNLQATKPEQQLPQSSTFTNTNISAVLV